MSRELKIEAARAALETVQSGMRIGIGTGSTADEFIKLLAQKISDGLDIIGVPTSERTRDLCGQCGVPLKTLEDLPELDLVIDGADEIDPALNLIKGAGGALLREKIVAAASKRMIVIADDSKLVEKLGGLFPVPIEVDQFGLASTQLAVESVADELGLERKVELRKQDDGNYITDGGHFILDASFGHIPNAEQLSKELLNIPGVIEHGMFLGYASTAFLAGNDGIKRLGE